MKTNQKSLIMFSSRPIALIILLFTNSIFIAPTHANETLADEIIRLEPLADSTNDSIAPQASASYEFEAYSEANTNSLQGLIHELISKHPLLSEFRHKINAQRAKVTHSKAPPNPKVGVEVRTNKYPFNMSSIGDLPNNFIGFSMAQEIVIPGKLKLKGRIEESEAVKLENNLNLSELILVSKLKQDFYELYFIDQSIRIYNKIKDLLITLENTVAANYKVGKGTQFDLLRVQLEKSKVIEQIEALTKDRKVFVAEVNSLVLREPLTELKPDYQNIELNRLPMDEEATIAKAKANYPKLLAQSATIQKSLDAVKLTKREYIPNLTLKGFYGLRGRDELDSGDELGGLFAVGIETYLPVFFIWKERKKHQEAEETLKAEEESYKSLELDTQFQVEKLYTLVDKSNVLAELLDTAIIPQASLTTDASIATYKVGQTDFPSVLDSIKDLLNFEIEFHMRVAQGLKNIANLEPLLGERIELGESQGEVL